jgi:hypothetical protein
MALLKFLQGNELIARVHLQMLLGKRRIELEARFECVHVKIFCIPL